MCACNELYIIANANAIAIAIAVAIAIAIAISISIAIVVVFVFVVVFVVFLSKIIFFCTVDYSTVCRYKKYHHRYHVLIYTFFKLID